jgi:diguanylate cyclase (GGDEF)-like protein/PAS domain S-box-containing protein
VDFHPGNAAIAMAHTVSVPAIGGTVIATSSFAILGLAIASSFLDRLLASRTSDLNFTRERELYLQTMAETIPEIIWTADAQGSTDFTNRKWLDYSGLTPEQSKGSGWITAVHLEDREAARLKWQEATREEEPYETELRFRGKDGVFRWFLARANPVRDASGAIVKWFGTCTDIESQKYSQKILREQIVESTRQLADANMRLQEEQYFRKLTDGIPEIIWTADPQGMVDYVNRKIDYIGRATEQIYGMAWAEAIHSDDLPLVLEKWQAALRTGQAYEVEYRLHGKDGDFRWFLVRANPIRNEAGEIVKWIGTCTDIENQKKSQQILEQQILERTMQLADANQRLQREMSEKDDARKQLDNENEKSMKDLEQRSERAGMLAKMGELLQSCISRDEVIAVALSFAPKIFPTGRGAVFLLNDARTLAELAGSWSECQLPGMDFETSECWALRTGHLHLVYADDPTARCKHAAQLQSSHLCVPILAQGEALGILHLQAKENTTRLDPAELSFRMTFAGQVGLSITNIKLRDALRTQSIRDALTGLYNRRYLEEILEREFRRSSRSQQHLGIIMIDLDHFKSFNDAFGHDAGDGVLRETGMLLTKCIRAEDFVCRYGGEEFVVILPTANLHAAQARAENLRTRMRQLTILYQGKPMGMITISAGVAGFPDHGTTPQQVIAAADAALYEAKRNGRDQVVIASTPAKESIELSPSANSAQSCQI